MEPEAAEPQTERFFQIRVNGMEFREDKTTAIYFYDVTHHIKSMKLEAAASASHFSDKVGVRAAMMRSDADTITKKFRTPLTVSLMLLENLVGLPELTESSKQTLWLVILQINLLICSLSDAIDLQAITSERFLSQQTTFSPVEVIEFVVGMFSTQTEMQRNTLTF